MRRIQAGKLRHFADVLQSGVPTCEQDQPIALLLKFLMEAAQGVRGRPEARTANRPGVTR